MIIGTVAGTCTTKTAGSLVTLPAAFVTRTV
jgi:hypothetical protein